MTLHHLSKAQLVKKIELDQSSIDRAKQVVKDFEGLRAKVKDLEQRGPVEIEVIKEVPYEVVKEVEVIKEVLPAWVDEDALKAFVKVRGML